MKVPKKAEKKFDGIIFDVYQWEQEMFDGSKETFEMLKRPDTVQVIAVQGDKILIAEETQPMKENFLALFGGRVEKGEDALSCAKRELLEESGYESDDWELWNKIEPYNKVEWTVHFYIARNCKKIAKQNLDAGEKITIKELSFAEFIETCISDKFWGKDFTMELLKMKVNGELEDFEKKLIG